MGYSLKESGGRRASYRTWRIWSNAVRQIEFYGTLQIGAKSDIRAAALFDKNPFGYFALFYRGIPM
jgi:hypothetical protein